ncbi:MAG: trehalose-phosphatase [Caulobacteraceae bacterium]
MSPTDPSAVAMLPADGGSRASLPEPPPLRLGEIALFADLDGTLAPIEETPDAVGPDKDRRRLLSALGEGLGGRLAVVSGRSLSDLDRVLEGKVPAVAAVHGLVRRTAEGAVVGSPAEGAMRKAASGLADFARADPRLMVEDKGLAAALHFRRAPEIGPACQAAARRLADELGLVVQEGDMVAEVRSRGPDKGEAMAAFMGERPFHGFTPVFLGDDLTDEAGFLAAAGLGGFGVVVGRRRPTNARYALADVAAAREWLKKAVAAR